MEKILIYVVTFIVLIIVNMIWKAIVAASRTAAGKGSFSENFVSELSKDSMEKLQMRIIDQQAGKDNHISIKSIEVKGLLPNLQKMRMAFVTSVLDVTNENKEIPIISIMNEFQEKNTNCFQNVTELGAVDPSLGYHEWVRAGFLIPDILQTPYGGKRKIKVILRLVDLENPPTIDHGLQYGHAGVLWARYITIDHHFEGYGYIEVMENKEEAEKITIQVGVAVAMSDGDLAQTEGATVKNWIEKLINHTDVDQREKEKLIYNEALKEAYLKIKTGELNISALLSRLNQIGDKKCKYDVIDLCFEIVAADGKMEAEELKLVQNIAVHLGLDFNEIQKIKDHKIVELSMSQPVSSNVFELLGVEPNWSSEQVTRHLRQEFQKWNSRLNSLQEGPERENAQRMLDLISEARSKLHGDTKKSA